MLPHNFLKQRELKSKSEEVWRRCNKLRQSPDPKEHAILDHDVMTYGLHKQCLPFCKMNPTMHTFVALELYDKDGWDQMNGPEISINVLNWKRRNIEHGLCAHSSHFISAHAFIQKILNLVLRIIVVISCFSIMIS